MASKKRLRFQNLRVHWKLSDIIASLSEWDGYSHRSVRSRVEYQPPCGSMFNVYKELISCFKGQSFRRNMHRICRILACHIVAPRGSVIKTAHPIRGNLGIQSSTSTYGGCFPRAPPDVVLFQFLLHQVISISILMSDLHAAYWALATKSIA